MTDEQKRRTLLSELANLEKSFQTKLDELSDMDISEKEYDESLAKISTEYDSVMWPKYWQAFSLQFKRRRGWFAETFAPSFGVCENKPLTLKQTEVFRLYCEPDSETWRSGKLYARFGSRFVILAIPKYSNGKGYLTIKEF